MTDPFAAVSHEPVKTLHPDDPVQFYMPSGQVLSGRISGATILRTAAGGVGKFVIEVITPEGGGGGGQA